MGYPIYLLWAIPYSSLIGSYRAKQERRVTTSEHSKRASARLNIATVLAATFAATTGFDLRAGGNEPRKQRKPVPTMVVSPPTEIAAWNRDVEARKPARKSGMPRKPRDTGQHPKFPKARVNKQHIHPLRDEHGAYTLVGRPALVPNEHPDEFDIRARRMWLAGISAQRGY